MFTFAEIVVGALPAGKPQPPDGLDSAVIALVVLVENVLGDVVLEGEEVGLW